MFCEDRCEDDETVVGVVVDAVHGCTWELRTLNLQTPSVFSNNTETLITVYLVHLVGMSKLMTCLSLQDHQNYTIILLAESIFTDLLIIHLVKVLFQRLPCTCASSVFLTFLPMSHLRCWSRSTLWCLSLYADVCGACSIDDDLFALLQIPRIRFH